jgi:hypothetical protein
LKPLEVYQNSSNISIRGEGLGKGFFMNNRGGQICDVQNEWALREVIKEYHEIEEGGSVRVLGASSPENSRKSEPGEYAQSRILSPVIEVPELEEQEYYDDDCDDRGSFSQGGGIRLSFGHSYGW